MFSLLRRTKNKKARDQFNDAPKNSANQQNNASTTKAAATMAATGARTFERYRQFSDSESEAGLTAITVRKPHIRAPIEEFEDLRDLENNEGDDDDYDDNDAGEDEAVLPTSSASFGDDDKIYFERNRKNDRLCEEEEKVNLAKTAANFRPNEAEEEAEATATTSAVRDRTSNLKSNSAIKTNNHQAFALSKFDGDRGDAVYFADIQRKTSQNEQAEWQGHVSSTTSGNRKIIDKSIECNSSECFFSPSLLYSSKQFNNSVPTTTTTTTTTKTATAAISTAKDAERPVIADTTTRDTKSNSATADDTVINQVKYRNLGNSQTVKNKKNSEAKRQSRLSLTFGGLGLTTHGKGKSAAETTTTTTDSKQVKKSSVVPSALRKSFFHNKTKSIDNDQEVIGKNEHKERQNSKLNSQDAIAIKSEETDKKLGPIQKSREFFSDIFMARGRNHNRNRNQMQQQNQPQQQQQLQSQQQQLQPPQEPSSHQSSSNQQQPQSLESCKHATVSSGGSNNHNNNHFNSTMNINQNDNNAWRNWSSLHSTHLETISDPSSVSTNSYQMTMSNNSPKNFSQIKVDDNDNDDDERQQRSNSAEHNHNSREEHSSAEYSREQRRARSLSQDYHKAGANKTNSARNNQEPVSPPLNNANDEGQYFIHAANTEKNGADTADTAEEQNSHQDQQRELEAAININKRRETIPTNLEGAIRDGCSSAKRPFNELTECDRDSLLHSAALPNAKSRIDERDAYDLSNDNDTVALLMGQTSGKPETPSNTRASTPREFRESKIPESQEFGRVGDISENNVGEQSKGIVPTITVVDYSDGDGSGSSSGLGSPVEQEVFYDFENARHDKRDSDGVNITNIEDDDEQDDGIEDDNDTDDDNEENVFHEQQQQQQQAAPSVYQQKWPRQNRTILENVIEQEEEDDIEGADNAANLDHEQCSSSHFDSPERNPLKSGNTSDSNLSTSFPDSGIGDSLASSSSTHSAKHFRDNDIGAVDSSATSVRFASLHLQQQRLPFVRDGNSTDCDDTLMQFDDLDYVAEGDVGSTNPNERLVCIESISLPDVVVESTTGTSGSNSSASLFTGGLSSSSSSTTGGEHIVNINGATGNSMGSVHFIPIHVEGGDNGSSQKRRSVDDSVIGGNKNFAHMNGHHSKPTIEIIEDASELNIGRSKSFSSTDDTSEKLKRELFEQKSRFSVQLEDAEKNVHNLQTKVNDMQTKIDKLEQELSTKAWNVERLQGELSAAQRDDEYVRKKLKLLEDEKTLLRHKYSENEDELKIKYEDLDTQYMDLQEKYKLTQKLACNLQTQLAVAQSEAESWRNEVDKIREELEEQTRILKNALDNSEAERRICEDKWQKEFEMLRTQNLETEETLMTDCEWQLRQMQKQCKDKVDKSQHGRLEALEKAEMLENELQERRKEVNDLKVYQAEVKSLRGVVSEQENSIQSLMDQIENLKADLEEANENLEEQIEAVKKIKYQCDNAIYDKERQMIYRIDEVRNEAAAFWEDKLYTEMTRLKNELESVYVDERRDALDKLQAEHIEELRALTTRYTANEEELRVELADLQDRFDNKNEEFLELREKSDNALLQTRMHLDRADREFQTAMFREEERREALEESLRKEFEEEKEEMEEKFCERLGHVKEEFARELQISTQELTDQHKKDLEQYKVKLHTERDEALQELAERHRQKLAAAEEKRKDIELRQQRDLKDLKAAYDAEKTALDKRDISNANEIEQLHRKCRCLTNLFEEMRMRYERRDPRPEDLREIAELRSRCESQERDLYLLTDRLRDMQIQMSELQRNNECTNTSNKNKSNKQIKKPPPKTIPTNCDVIYEENEERDSPPPPLPSTLQNEADDNEDDDGDADEQEEDVSEDESSPPGPVIELNNKIGKTVDRISEDESHMISAV